MSRKNTVAGQAKRAAAADKKLRASGFDSFQNLAAKVGLGTDNPSSYSTYGFNPITRLKTQLEWIHRGSWLGGVAVDIVANDMTRAGVTLKGVIDPDDMKTLQTEATSLGLWNSINKTIKWARLYGGAICVMLVDGQDMASELRLETIGKRQFKGLLVLDRWQVEPSLNDLNNDLGPMLGLPLYYTVNQNAPALRGKKIHHSRCLRMIGAEVPYQQSLIENLWGTSVYERLYDRLVSFDSATLGASQLVYKAYLRTYKIKELRSIVAAGGKALDGLANYIEHMRRFQVNEGVTLLDAEDEFEAHQISSFGGISDVINQIGQQLSGALQIPLVRLFGQSPAGLNSTGESDLVTYYDGIFQNQESVLRIPVTAMYRGMAASIGIKLNDDFHITFNPLWQMTDQQKAEVAGGISTAVTGAYQANVINQKTAMKELRQSSEYTGVFTNITDEDIEAAEEDMAPEPEPVEEDEGEPATPKNKDKAKRAKARDARHRMNDALAATAHLAQAHDLHVVIENPKGSVRSGEGWSLAMPADYGYLRRHTGSDGEELDCFVGSAPAASTVYVIDQVDPISKEFDEHKVMLSYESEESAVHDYLLAYSDGPDRLGTVTALTMEEFKDFLKTPAGGR